MILSSGFSACRGRALWKLRGDGIAEHNVLVFCRDFERVSEVSRDRPLFFFWFGVTRVRFVEAVSRGFASGGNISQVGDSQWISDARGFGGVSSCSPGWLPTVSTRRIRCPRVSSMNGFAAEKRQSSAPFSILKSLVYHAWVSARCSPGNNRNLSDLCGIDDFGLA